MSGKGLMRHVRCCDNHANERCTISMIKQHLWNEIVKKTKNTNVLSKCADIMKRWGKTNWPRSRKVQFFDPAYLYGIYENGNQNYSQDCVTRNRDDICSHSMSPCGTRGDKTVGGNWIQGITLLHQVVCCEVSFLGRNRLERLREPHVTCHWHSRLTVTPRAGHDSYTSGSWPHSIHTKPEKTALWPYG